MTVAYVGLGANLGDREESIRKAAELIGAVRISSIRETEPWGVTDQPLFLNAVAELDWPGSAEELLERLLEVERDLGRVRDGSRWGPREIDLDLLVFGSRGDRRARADGAAPRARGSAVRARAARGARARAGRARLRHGFGLVVEATIPAMSHLDELDDYEAELELRLKKEYSAVYSLFRYCVLTQDNTYLCNKLDMQYVPQAAYPFCQLKLEDVWVWDKSRPTRMIPRVEVLTTGDVTVEELRADGEEPPFTADELAKRMTEPRPQDEEQ